MIVSEQHKRKGPHFGGLIIKIFYKKQGPEMTDKFSDNEVEEIDAVRTAAEISEGESLSESEFIQQLDKCEIPKYRIKFLGMKLKNSCNALSKLTAV